MKIKLSFIFTLFFIATALVYSNQSNNSSIKSFEIKNAEAENKNTYKLASNYEDPKDKSVVINDKQSLNEQLDSYSKISECLNEQFNYCNQFNAEYRNNKLFISNRTHMHREIANFLQSIKTLSEYDPEYIGRVDAKKLISFLKLTDNRSPVLALELLLEKTLSSEEQNIIISEVASNTGDNQWQLYKLLLSMEYLTDIQIQNIVNSINNKLNKTEFLYQDMQLISNLDSLFLTPNQLQELSSTLCKRMDEMNVTNEFKERVYYASKIKCN